MPLYDYRCDQCGNFRAFRPMAQSGADHLCPNCGERSERVLSAPFLAGGQSGAATAQRPMTNGRVPWRSACGFGCTHAHH